MGVFHPNHDEMHGFTVVITTSDGQAYLGRWMEEEAGRVRIVDAAHFVPEQDASGHEQRDAFIKQAALWGVQPSAPQMMIERERIEEVRKLGDVATQLRGW